MNRVTSCASVVAVGVMAFCDFLVGIICLRLAIAKQELRDGVGRSLQEQLSHKFSQAEKATSEKMVAVQDDAFGTVACEFRGQRHAIDECMPT